MGVNCWLSSPTIRPRSITTRRTISPIRSTPTCFPTSYPKHRAYLVSGVHYTVASGVETIVTITDAKHAKELYAKMTADGRDAFDKVVKINY